MQTNIIADVSNNASVVEMNTKAVDVLTRYAIADEKSIAYRIMGSGRVIILCQRFRGNIDDWDPAFLDALAEHFRVVIFDYSGLGLSGGEPSVNMKDFAEDVRFLAGYLQIDRFVIGGWSFGGAVAQVTLAEFPDFITHCILLGTRPPSVISHPPDQLFLSTSFKPVNDLEDEIILFFYPESAASREAAVQSHARIAERTVDRSKYIPPHLWENYIKGFEDFTLDTQMVLQKLTTTDIPVLVISGDREIVFPLENWFRLIRKLPTTQILSIPNAGHGPHHEHPVMISEYIRVFCNSL